MSQLLANCTAVAPATRIAPCNNGAVALHGSKCFKCGINFMHIALQLPLYGAAVAPILGKAPGHNRSVVPQGCESSLRRVNTLHTVAELPLHCITITASDRVPPSDD
eukprot:gnl/TRDRNA2_/TRDRNA2_173941_c1_seq5.p1 gnl/TRDRNA2_/TRDRNA2_173941_c1~~gnl/TRDRNA2_/TRDRNA2_173941_c1_seq5.p1  ORF type:complete len:107 (+),score=0.01 gnl/TRDRNA2_/TRDRNA2_173941_c1_seq5:491-811(+)